MNRFVIEEAFAKQLLVYLLGRPMNEVEPLVNQLRALPSAQIIAQPNPDDGKPWTPAVGNPEPMQS